LEHGREVREPFWASAMVTHGWCGFGSRIRTS
jgi:hypothetical protein